MDEMLPSKDTGWLNGWNNKPSICCLQETHFRAKATDRLKVKGWKQIFHANGTEKKSGVAILIWDKVEFKTKKSIMKDKKGHYMVIKGSVQEDITLVNIYAPNIVELTHIRQILIDIKWETDKNTIIVEDFNTPLTSMNRSSKMKINKETEA